MCPACFEECPGFYTCHITDDECENPHDDDCPLLKDDEGNGE
jgi:hypothetical protein